MEAGRRWHLLCLALAVCSAVPACASSPPGEHTFAIRHDQSGKCLTAQDNRLSLENCSQANNALWKWGSAHRLFSLGTQKCLGVNVSNRKDPLALVSCDSALMLWWWCEGRGVSGASGYGLTVKDGAVAVAMKPKDEWRQHGKFEAICDVPYHVVYTTGANSAGKPCDFPFLYNGSWYHDCIRDAEEDREWCVTSQSLDYVLFGNCLKPVSGCNGTWVQNAELQQCYQINANSVLKWKEAYLSCQSQGANLLSISSPQELQHIIESENLPESIWIGLNRLESSSGWQWSDNSPLNFVNWDKGITAFSLIDGSSCGKLNVNSGQFEIFPCDAALPYVCEKAANETKTEPTDYWHYSETECPAGWMSYNGFCYMSQEPRTWQEADISCEKENASLISLHSLADIELAVTKFQSENKNVWSGFHSLTVPPLFKWSDETEVHFTYWDQKEPLPPFNVTPNCVCFSGQTGRWHVENCEEKLKSICRKPGVLKNASNSDSGCPQDKDWRRHGEYCYLINATETSFEERCNLTITSRFEQEFLNSLIRQQNKMKGKYFWTSLQDVNSTGDYYWQTANGTKDLTYSNWNTHQPGIAGGCVAMSAGGALGKWEVKDCKTFQASSICKKTIGAEEEETPKPPPTSCPDAWSPGADQYCYKLFHKEILLRQRTWEEAEGICEEFGGHLVSFSHMQDMNNLSSFLNSLLGSQTRWIWLGLNKRNLGNWEWSDGRPISSTVLSDFQEEDYSLRDCAAFEINLPKRTYWMGILDIVPIETTYKLKPFHCEARLDWVCQVPKGTPTKTPNWYKPDWRSKMVPAVTVEGGEYWFVSDTKLGYKEAALYCASNGSALATIDSFTAMKTIQGYLNKQGTNNKLLELVQKWWIKSWDFHPFKLYRVFGSGAREECNSITALSHFPDDFQSINCNEKLPFICRSQNFSLLEIATTEVINSSLSCPENMTLFGNKCFMKVPEKNLTFSNASIYCKSFGGFLPSITNQFEQDFITYLSSDLQPKFWIGFRLVLNTYKNSWADGTEVTYTNFHRLLQGRYKHFQYDPVNMEKNQQCVFFLNDPKSSFVGTWDFTACSDLHYVSICQREADNSGKTGETGVPVEVSYKERKYKFIQKNITWYEALSECDSSNMDLVSITDQYQLSFITSTVGRVGQPMWIGLSSRDDGIHYRWQDGSLVTLNRWSEESLEEDCAFIALDGRWKTERCDIELPGAICHVPPETPANKTPAADCPHRLQDTIWIPYRNSCYAFLLTHKRWLPFSSRYVCHTLHPDAFVLSIRDEDENMFVSNHLQPYADLAKGVWLGLLYDSSTNGFLWHDQTFVQFSNWREGRPNITNDTFFAAMGIDGLWDIYPNPNDFELLSLQQHSIVACKIEKGSPNGDYFSPMPSSIPYYDVSYFVLTKKLAWLEAVKECKKNDGHLASVHNAHQQLLLEHIVRHDGFALWVGLWNNDGSSMEWSDGTKINYATKYIEKKLDRGNCLYMDTKGNWIVKNCSETLEGAICYKNYSAIQLKLSSKEELCPQTPGTGRWVRHKDFCYGFDVKIYDYSVHSNAEARRVCQTVDSTATLLTIKDDEENAFVSRYLNTDPYVTSRVWLGVNSTSTGQKSVWLDGSPMEYKNWGSSQTGGTGLCAILLPETGTWSNVPCAQGYGRVVCKSPIRPSGSGLAIAFAVALICVLIIGLLVYLYRKKNIFSSSIRYRRAEDQMESMIDYS